MERMLWEARRRAEAEERAEVAERVTARHEVIGGSTSRLSTYVTGRVAPSSTMLVRMERVALADRA